jgi:hypothetical protein
MRSTKPALRSFYIFNVYRWMCMAYRRVLDWIIGFIALIHHVFNSCVHHYYRMKENEIYVC